MLREETVPIYSSPLSRALHRLMRETGKVNMKRLSNDAGLGDSFVRDILTGKSKNPEASSLVKLAEALGCTVEALLSPDQPSVKKKARTEWELRAARFRAARWACWGDDMKEAASALKVSVSVLQDIEVGEMSQVGPAVLRTLEERTGIPTHWVETGSMEGMPLRAAARIGHFDISLVDETEPTNPSHR
jgi:transcriptional regulator with XRE-family HTH domain